MSTIEPLMKNKKISHEKYMWYPYLRFLWKNTFIPIIRKWLKIFGDNHLWGEETLVFWDIFTEEKRNIRNWTGKDTHSSFRTTQEGISLLQLYPIFSNGESTSRRRIIYGTCIGKSIPEKLQTKCFILIYFKMLKMYTISHIYE